MKRQVEELKMFRISLGVIRLDMMRNEYIKRKTQVKLNIYIYIFKYYRHV